MAREQMNRFAVREETQESRRGDGMKIALSVGGTLLVFFGVFWYMSEQIRWAVYGGIALVAGIALLLGANRRQKT
jgi:hypothetical protein